MDFEEATMHRFQYPVLLTPADATAPAAGASEA